MNQTRKTEINRCARQLLRDMWQNRGQLVTGTPSPFQMLNPERTAAFLGLQFDVVPTLGRFGSGDDKFEVAGIIDRFAGRIAVSAAFDSNVQRYTAAHELGHYCLHPNSAVSHRDRPVKGWLSAGAGRPQIEAEADYFAACYLMPDRLVEAAFERSFGVSIQHFTFNESEAWRMCPDDSESLLRPRPGARARGLALARFKAGARQSLAEVFLVSPQAMAIRLEELGLQAEWP